MARRQCGNRDRLEKSLGRLRSAMQGSPFIGAGHIIQRARRQHASTLIVGAAISAAVPRPEISIRSVTRTVKMMITVVGSHSCMMSRLVTASGLFFCDRLSRRCSVLGCSRCWVLGLSSRIVLRLRHRNCECYRGRKADSEYGRHLFHRFAYGSTKASRLRAFPENRQRRVRFLAFLCLAVPSEEDGTREIAITQC